MTVNAAALDRFAQRVRQLYSLPAVAVKILELTNQPHVDLRAIKACIENDPALCTKILRVVNSSLFGLSREVRDLNQALALLGLKPLKLLVLGFSLSETLCGPQRGKAVDRYWRHTLTQAVAAREISERIWNLPGDEAFLAALLQNVGMLVLLHELGEPYARFLDRILAADRDVAAGERNAFGFDYHDLGARLLEQWRLPASLIAAIQRSLLPADADDDQAVLPRILRMARLLADLLVDRRHATLELLLAAPVPKQPVTVAQIEALLERLDSKVAQLAEVLACELPAGVDYRDVLIEAHRRMSNLTGEMAIAALDARADADAADELALLAEVQGLGAVMERLSGRAADAEPPLVRAAVRKSAATVVAPAAAPHVVPASTVTVGQDLREKIARAVAAGRQHRAPLSLILIEIDCFEALARAVGPFAAEQVVQSVGRLAAACDVPGAVCSSERQACFGLLLPGCDRGEAVKHGNLLLQGMRELSAREQRRGRPTITVSLGITTVPSPPKNFRVDDLIDSANRCLSAAQLSGGNTLKSIGIY